MDIESYILSELKKKNIAIKDAVEQIGVSKQTFYNKIKSSKQDLTFLTKVKEILGLDINFQDPEIVSPSGTIVLNTNYTQRNKRLIPFYNSDFMAGTLETIHNDGSDHPDYFMDIPEFSGCTAFRAFGDSMEPIIKSSCILFGTKEEEWNVSLEYGQIYGITMLNGRRYLKYIRRADDHKNMFLLKSENSSYDDFEVRKDKIKNIWLIQGWLDKRA